MMQRDMGEYVNGEQDQDDTPKWYYLTDDGACHGAFKDSDMQKWYTSGYFPDRLQIRTVEDDKFYSLYDYQQVCNGSPFLGNTYSLNHAYLYERQQSTPIPMGMPIQPVMMQPPNSQGYGASPLYIPSNSSPMTNYSLQPMMMMPPPGMTSNSERYDDHQMFTQQDVYGLNERENPSSSSLSETPDSERCLHMVEDLQLSVLSTDKCVGTEDAPWLISTKVDAETDTPADLPSLGVNTGCQTVPIFIKSKDMVRVLKDLTGIPFNTNYYYRQ